MGTQVEVAKHRLFDQGTLNVADVKLFPGSSADTTPEQRASEITRVLAQIEAGDFEAVEADEDEGLC